MFKLFTAIEIAIEIACGFEVEQIHPLVSFEVLPTWMRMPSKPLMARLDKTNINNVI